MYSREVRARPHSWAEHRRLHHPAWTYPFHAVEWVWQWTAWYLGRWAFLEVLEYMGSLSVLVAVVFYFADSGNRVKQRHYQAWQVINTAQGKGGSGGRIEALQELNADQVPLVGLDVSDAFLMGVQLPKAELLRANLSAADLRRSDFSESSLEYANLASANFRNANLRKTNFRNADLSDTDLTGADLTGADLAGADLSTADLNGIQWRGLHSVEKTNFYGVQNPPAGFLEWALKNSAISTKPDSAR